MRFVSGMEEPLGLRIVVNGLTHQIPNVVDPSELRSDVSGKLVRYLQKDGAQVLPTPVGGAWSGVLTGRLRTWTE